MDTLEKDKDLKQMLKQAKLELSQSRKALIRQSLRESKPVTTGSPRINGTLVRKPFGVVLAVFPALVLVGLFTFALHSHLPPTSQSGAGQSPSKNTSSLLPQTPPYNYMPLLGF